MVSSKSRRIAAYMSSGIQRGLGREILGIIGAHVDDLLISGCDRSANPLFEEALAKLTTNLPFGERKYADASPVIHTGINLRQHPQTREVTIDQAHCIENLREVPLTPLQDGLLDKKGQTGFWSQLGALLWVSINTRPDIAYDVSHYASYETKPEKQHVAALNKIVRTLKVRVHTITFQRVAKRWDDMTCRFHGRGTHLQAQRPFPGRDDDGLGSQGRSPR